MQDLVIIFLSERKASSVTIERLKQTLQMFGVAVASEGQSGGLGFVVEEGCGSFSFWFYSTVY